MLSRTADHLYWMSRYTERAENTARMLDVNYQTSLLPQSAAVAQVGWEGLLAISELLPTYKAKYGDEIKPRHVLDFMVRDESNPSSIIACLKAAREFVDRWRKSGGGFELEQFGSGLNSFQSLKHIDADYLKLDRALTSDLAHRSENELKVRELCSQAHAAGKRTVVEWIEEASSMPALFSAGVDFAQGNFLASPVPEMRYVT